jgi:TonB-dependent receptor
VAEQRLESVVLAHPRRTQGFALALAALLGLHGSAWGQDVSASSAATSDGETLQEVTVLGQYIQSTTTREAALSEKQQAPNILDVQPLSEIQKLPDINMAEALQRIPGVSLETDSGEGRFINIRGLDSDLNSTSYAGVRLPASNPSSPFGGSRAVALDTFPTGIVGGVEVSKTLRPDMDAEGLGGTINLVPRTGAEHGGAPFLDANIGGGDEPLRGTPVFHGEVSAGRSFDGGDGIGGLFSGANAFGVVISAVYQRDRRGVDDVEESYNDSPGVSDKLLSDLQFRWYEYHRARYGVAGNFDARANDNTTLYLRLLWSGYMETANKHYLVLNGLDSGGGAFFCAPPSDCNLYPNGFVALGGQLLQQTTDTLERVQYSMAILGGSSTLSKVVLDYHGAYVVGSDRFSTSYGSIWTDPNAVPIAYDNNTDPRYPKYHTLDGTNPADPSNYALQEIDLGPSYDQDAEWSGAIDATIPPGALTSIGQWKFGAMLRLRHKTHWALSPVFTPNGTIPLPPYTFGPDQIYYNNLYNIGPMISLPAVRALANSNLGTITDDLAADASGTFNDNENVYGGYGQYDARFGQFGVLAGVRVESTQATYRGNIYNSDNDTNTPATTNASYTDVFPTLQGRYNFQDNLIGRLTYATGIARPGFEQITPGATISVSSASVTVGNPALKPTIGQNLDATLEFYPGDGQVAAAGLFYKHFTNYILLTQVILPGGYPFPGLTGVSTTVQTYFNGPAHAYGLEAQYQQQLLMLPAPWSGFGYSGNITLVDSEAQIHPGMDGTLPSTSHLTWNAAIFYERNPFEVRLAADYVGQNLFAFGTVLGNETDVYSSARLTMDLGSSYNIDRALSVYFDAKNLLNTPLEFTEGPSSSRPIQREFYDITLLAGVRLSL